MAVDGTESCVWKPPSAGQQRVSVSVCSLHLDTTMPFRSLRVHTKVGGGSGVNFFRRSLSGKKGGRSFGKVNDSHGNATLPFCGVLCCEGYLGALFFFCHDTMNYLSS